MSVSLCYAFGVPRPESQLAVAQLFSGDEPGKIGDVARLNAEVQPKRLIELRCSPTMIKSQWFQLLSLCTSTRSSRRQGVHHDR